MKLKSIAGFFEYFKNLSKDEQDKLCQEVRSLLIKK